MLAQSCSKLWPFWFGRNCACPEANAGLSGPLSQVPWDTAGPHDDGPGKCVDKARVTGLQGVWPLLNENCWEFLSWYSKGRQRDVFVFSMDLTWHPSWVPWLRPRPQNHSRSSTFLFICIFKSGMPPEEWPDFSHSCGDFSLCFFFHVAQPRWHSDTVGLPCGTCSGQSPSS